MYIGVFLSKNYCYDLIFGCTNNEIGILYNTGSGRTIMCEITRSQDIGFSNLFCNLVYLRIEKMNQNGWSLNIPLRAGEELFPSVPS